MTIEVGSSYVFYCEIQQDYKPPEERLRRFTGQTVTVVSGEDTEPGPEASRIFVVRAPDGTEFSAYEEELSGWDKKLGQYFNPDGTWGPNRETWPLVNERDDGGQHE